jgi:hypothetical protein
MFVRKKKNNSGTTSVVVVDKSKHQFRKLKTIGVSSDEKIITELNQSGKKWVAAYSRRQDMFVVQAQQE